MSILFENARVLDPHKGTLANGSLGVKSGKICAAKNGGFKETIDCQGAVLSPGFIDLGVKVCEPGERHKESFSSAGTAAAIGGVTTMVIRPDTLPAIDSPETLDFVHRRAVTDSPVNVLPMAALTKGREGREMAEIGFLQDTGAVAFTDCDEVIHDNKIFARCLSYAASMNALVILHAQDPSLSKGAAATSGPLATKLGLPAVSPIAERLGIERIVAFAEMTGARIHIDQVTTAAGLTVLERAKASGLAITAGTSIHHLTLNEFDIEGYRTFFKVKPPLRSEDDRLATVEALASGLIELACSMHTPQDEESKRLPFEAAASGAVGLETMFPAMMRLVHAEQISLVDAIHRVTAAPAKLLGLEAGSIANGAPADLVLFDPDKPYVMDRSTLSSKSKNTPFDSQRLQGRILGSFVAGREVYRA